MNSHLFVYGTLMSAASGELGREERRRLANEARNMGPATMHGVLHDLGDYPGFVPDGGPRALVHGELLEIAHTARTFSWLDAYEGVVPGAADGREYERLHLPVQRAVGGGGSAWVYVYRWDVSRARLVASGRWSAR